MDGRRRCAAIYDRGAMRSQIVRPDLGEKPTTPCREEFAFKDRATHRARAVGHGSRSEPLFAKLPETFGLLQAPLFALLFNRR